MAKDVFISYKSEEFKQADMVRSVLERNGITCWMAPADIPSGSNYAVEVPNAIRSARVVVFILSEQSQKSEWTQKELDIALNAKKPIMPFALEDCDLISPFDFYLGNVQRNDVFQDVSEGLEKLVHDIKALTGADDAAVDIPADTLQALRQSIVIKSGGNKLMPIIIACAVVVVAAIAAFAVLGGGNSSNASDSATVASTKQLAAEVYASQINSYMNAGTVNSYENMTLEGENSLTVTKAFSILSFIRNQGDTAAQVESVTMEISSLEPDETPDMEADATVVNGNTLLVYAANNGWGTAEDTTIDVYATKKDSTKRIELSDFATDVELDEARDFESGDVARPVKATVDIDKYKALADQNRTEYSLSLHAVDRATGDELVVWSLQWNENQGLNVFYGGIGGGGYSVSLFAVLDVDANPTSIRFTGEEANPRVEDTFRIETVVAPTKSCTVVCKDVYSVNGELQETPEYTVTVTVPVFVDGAFGNQHGITAELAAQPDMGDLQMQRVADEYRYDPQSVFDNSENALKANAANANAAASSSEKTASSYPATGNAVSDGIKYGAPAAETNADAATATVGSDGVSTRTAPFWGVWATATKDLGLAGDFAASARQAGYDAAVCITSEWGNLNSETWYVVTLCFAESESDANTVLERAKREGYADAYVKYSGERA